MGILWEFIIFNIIITAESLIYQNYKISDDNTVKPP